jgi:quinol monooxygenase YgiN
MRFLSRCLDALFFMDASHTPRWPAFCDEHMASLLSAGRTMTQRIEPLIVFSMEIVAPDEKRTAILRTLGSLLGPTRVAQGCMDARLYTDLDKRKSLILVEEWQSREHFERNLDASKLSTIVAAIELSSEAPVVHVDSVERQEGVETLAIHRTVKGQAMVSDGNEEGPKQHRM